MPEEVKYRLSLEDLLSGKLNNADIAAKKLEGSMAGLGKTLVSFAGAFASYEYLKGATEEWDKVEFAMSQVEAGLKSTQNAAGLTFDELKKGAEETSHNIKFTQADILGLQSILLTFPSVTKDTFGIASAAIEDMATRTGHGLEETAIQVGKALQDPERGIAALRKTGVNFSEAQQDVIKHLVETSHAAEAQALILKELNVEFGGSAAAAAEADKSFRLDKTMEENKVRIGELLDQLKAELMPALIWLADHFRDLVEWINKNAQKLKELAIALGVAWTAFKLFEGAAIILDAMAAGFIELGVGAMSATEGVTAFSLALDVSPLGVFAIALGAIAFAYTNIADAADRAAASKKKYLGDLANDELDFVQQRAAGYKDKHTEKQAMSLAMQDEAADISKSEITWKTELQNSLNALGLKSLDEYNGAFAATNGLDDNVQYALKELDKVEARKTGLSKVKDDSRKANGLGVPGKLAKSGTETKGASGPKVVNINVSIKNLIDNFTVKSTSVSESVNSIKREVAQALLSAVNDSEILAGQAQ